MSILIICVALAITAVGFFLFAELGLRTGEIMMWTGVVLLLLVLLVVAMEAS